MNIIKLMPLLGLVALSACKTGDDSAAAQESVEPISIMELGTASWVSPEEMSNPDVTRSKDILAANNMIVLDMSGSMGDGGCSGSHPTRAAAAKSALLTWINANPGGNVGLVAFNSGEGPKLWHGLGTGPSHAKQVVRTIEALEPDAGTPLSTAIEMAEQELKAQYVRQNGSGTYRMIIITDGQASNGYRPTDVVRAISRNPANPIEIHTIGFCIKGNHSLKDPNAVFYIDANSPEELVNGLNATQGEAQGFDPDDLIFEEIAQ